MRLYLYGPLQARDSHIKEETLWDLAAQEKQAFEGALSVIDGLMTKTGTKDKYLQHFVDTL